MKSLNLEQQRRHNLHRMINAESIAIIGASPDLAKAGGVIYKNTVEKFQGKIFPVNPKRAEISGKKCYASVSEINERIDLAVIAVPAYLEEGRKVDEIVLSIVKECVSKKVAGIVIVSAGFSEEENEQGVKREEKLKQLISNSATRIIGPNCLGIYNPEKGIDTLFMPDDRLGKPVIGGTSIISQSGALGCDILEDMKEINQGIRFFFSYGNAADVNENDLLECLEEDEKTKTAVMYIEGIRDGEKFYKIGTEFCRKKPLVVYKGGRSEKGARATQTHTGSLAGNYKITSDILHQMDAIEVTNIERIFACSKALEMQPKARGNRIAMISNSGGHKIVSLDEVSELGIEVASIGKQTQKNILDYFKQRNIRMKVSESAAIDLTGTSSDADFIKIYEELAKDPAVDAVLVILVFYIRTITGNISKLLALAEKHNKPLVVCVKGRNKTEYLKDLDKKGIPAYASVTDAAYALRTLLKKK